jgi:hypothetical protein
LVNICTTTTHVTYKMVQVNERTQRVMGYQSPSSGLLRDFTPLKCERLKLPSLSKAEADNHVSHCSAFEIGSFAVAKEFSTSQETRIDVGVGIDKVINEEASTDSTRVESPSLIDEETLCQPFLFTRVGTGQERLPLPKF